MASRRRQGMGTTSQTRKGRCPSPVFDESFEQLMSREVIPTKYLDENMLTQLGVREEIYMYLEAVGWGKLFDLKDPTYIGLTQEFLCHYEYKVYSTLGQMPEWISFVVGGCHVQISLQQLCEIFGFDHGEDRDRLRRWNAGRKWSLLTHGTGDYQAGKSKSSCIVIPSLRILHKAMVCTIFGRGLSHGAVNTHELFILNSMVEGRRVNLGYYMAKHLRHVAKQPKGDICVGGIVIYIIRHVLPDFDFVNQSIPPGRDYIDIAVLEQMGVCTRGPNGAYVLVGHDEPNRGDQADIEDELDIPTLHCLQLMGQTRHDLGRKFCSACMPWN